MPGNSTQRSQVLIGVALALPILVLAITQIALAFERQRADIGRHAIARAGEISRLVDAQLAVDHAAMEALATDVAFERRSWPEAYARAREIAALNSGWSNVIVSDLEAGEEVFSLRRPYVADHRAMAPVLREGAAQREGPGCPCVYTHLPIGQDERYLLSVAIDPQIFQTMLADLAPDDAIVGIIDDRQRIVARTPYLASRIGTEATQRLQDALAGGGSEGFYIGQTREGVETQSAFVVAPQSGWSVHVATASSLVDRPRTFSIAAILVGAFVALALAGGLIAWVLRDLAHRRQAEERMAQAQKLEAIGQLTGGVAHDFNNLLTVMIGGLNMLLRRIEDPKQREIAQHMLESAQRGDRLTKQLLAFSRGKQIELAPVDLLALAPGMEDLLRRSIEPNMELSFDLDPEARWVRSDSNQLELAILNLVINARDAMPDGGRIEVLTRPSRTRHDFIELAVRDSGIGMPKTVADRALEPFFTTKPAGKGTGLGLAQVFGAARQSGGAVEIDTAPGKGSTVRLVLPRAEPSATQESAAPEAEPQPAAPAQGQRVLVVDDEAGVRAFMADTLREAGYDVSEAAHPGEALQQLSANPPALLVTDYSMPGMTGLELAERGREAVGGLRILIVSGYADAAALDASASRPTLLRKPFDEAALRSAVQSLLES